MPRRWIRYSNVILLMIFAAVAWVALQRIDVIAAADARRQEIMWIVLLALLVGFIAAVIVNAQMSTRLRRLAERLLTEDDSVAGLDPGHLSEPPDAQDEIDAIEHGFLRLRKRTSDLDGRLNSIDAQRRELLANISHDLRTPLASMRGYLETLIIKHGTLTDDQQRHYLAVAEKQSERLEKLIADLFDLSKLESDTAKIDAETFPVTELIQDVAQKFELSADQKGIKIETNYGTGIPAVHADIGLIERALENLIGNALRHCEAGGKVTIALEKSASRVIIEVADTGSGIAPEHLPRVFDRFYQADRNYGANSGGAGLGLAITRRIVALHGSEIGVESALGKGTTFRFDLPVAQ